MAARAEAAQATARRVLDAALSLFGERPYEEVSLEAIGERADVTKQTVLRRFGSKEDLFVGALNQAGEHVIAQRDAAPVGDIAGAVANLVDHYETWGVASLRLLSQEDRIPIVAQQVRFGREYHRSWVERTFAPMLTGHNGAAKKRRVAALVAVTDVYLWKLLRRDLGLSRSETERTLVELVQSLTRRP
jgi:AcrR family transcriptional regulator